MYCTPCESFWTESQLVDGKCPDCGRKISVFGESGVDALALEYGIPNVAKIPIDSELTKAADTGNIENFQNNYLSDFFDKISKKLK